MKKTLVISVDIDDDLGRVGIKTPVVGWDEVVNAAVKFGIERPEDSDLNAIFAALQEAKTLGEESLVAIVSGSQRGGYYAIKKVQEQVAELVKKYNIDEIIVVTDNPEDENVVNAISELARVAYTRRVIVEQSRNIEQLYVLLTKFLRKALTEKRFARYTLGFPGLLIFTFSLLSLTGLMSYAIPIIGMLVGLSMIIRGFELDERIINWWKTNPISMAFTLISSTSMLIALVVSYLTVQQYGGINIRSISAIITNAFPYLAAGIALLLLTNIIEKIRRRDVNVWRDAIVLLTWTISSMILVKIGSVLASVPATATYGEMLKVILQSDVPTMLIYGMISILATAVSMILIERFIMDQT
ncbi:hypothetical protein EYM_02905 [Ignicoccus islandicus DSM 13165]|uniref:DUF373 family protein n=1 Tax=Ignicoccus islandicus DSM 13165 TaxID=940295 RepID=A0A0U3FSA6_9CREN|nr:DUF373 family protein [Ignicoccus islandicus]ALU12368.1 hypothetical protein EYM_02905 [Ignicoccus islandicus DSM 13165]